MCWAGGDKGEAEGKEVEGKGREELHGGVGEGRRWRGGGAIRPLKIGDLGLTLTPARDLRTGSKALACLAS